MTIHVPTASLDTRKAVWDPWWCETPSTLHTEDSELGPCEFISLPKASVESAKLNSQFLVTLGFFWKVPSSTRGVCSVPPPRLAALGLAQAQAEQRVKTGSGHELPFQVPSSVPGAFFTKVVDLGAASLKLEIWDTAGQEKYHSVCHLYFRGANAALVVYDVTRKVRLTWAIPRPPSQPVPFCSPRRGGSLLKAFCDRPGLGSLKILDDR